MAVHEGPRRLRQMARDAPDLSLGRPTFAPSRIVCGDSGDEPPFGYVATVQGSLFTQDFLIEGIAETDAWATLGAPQVGEFRAAASAVFTGFPVSGHPNEAQTEQDLIFPILRALGWEHYLTQQGVARGREDVPDMLLFADPAAKALANRERRSLSRYRHGVAIVENKAWNLPLDRGPPDLFNQSAPSTQMLRYLSRVEIESERAIQWGILTNGRHWRLYYQGARSRSEEFIEIDLPVVLAVPEFEAGLFDLESDTPDHFLNVFLLLFRREAFIPPPEGGATFHAHALVRTREWEAKVSDDLSGVVFAHVFPPLVRALAAADPNAPAAYSTEYLEGIRYAALALLYRLLFVLYAEDRNLLPAHGRGYDDYSLLKLRREVADRRDRHDQLSRHADRLYGSLKTTFDLIDVGDPALGLPPYNGGLFDHAGHEAARSGAAARFGDRHLSSTCCLDGPRRGRGSGSTIVTCRSSILAPSTSGCSNTRSRSRTARSWCARVPFARKTSGSYYTHDDLVRLIIERTVGPLIKERGEAFRAQRRGTWAERTPAKGRSFGGAAPARPRRGASLI